MKTTFLTLLIAIFIVGCGVADNPLNNSGGTEVKSSLTRELSPSDVGVVNLTAGNRDFGLALYQKVAAENPGKNVFISPHSISLALTMAYAGAIGDTASQMRTALAYGVNDDVLHESFNALDIALSQRGQEVVDDDTGSPFQLSVVNAAWGQNDYYFLDTYLDVLAVNYGSGMRLLDFMTNPDASRITINDWVAKQSMDRIKDLLPQGSISSMTRLVLTNVIYFKANWLNKFESKFTVDAPFTLLDGSTVSSKMMHTADDLQYGAGTGYEYLEVPYVGWNVAMMLILPDAGQFETVESALDGPTFGGMVADAVQGHGKLAMPRFTFGFESALNDSLKALGMTDAFAEGIADFSGMDGAPNNLFISLVQHKSFVAVDEDGTEAAAATAVVMDETSIPVDSFDMTFDRPFLFAIVDKPTGSLLFLGRVLDPSAE